MEQIFIFEGGAVLVRLLTISNLCGHATPASRYNTPRASVWPCLFPLRYLVRFFCERHRCEMASAGDSGGAARRHLVCVTGGSGFIGSWLVRLLLDRGYTVHATVKNLRTCCLSAPRAR